MLRRLLASLLAGLAPALVLAAPPAAAEAGYSPPVDGAVVDGWRPPTSPFGEGNRGIDLDAAPGDAVRASAGGEVVFAGRVGLDHHVVVLHDDGIRTSYSFLAEVGVARGDPVARGDVIGTAAGPVHFGARAGERYVDPTLLLSGSAPPTVRLVPVELRSPQAESTERRWLVDGIVDVLGQGWRAGAEAVAWARDGASDMASELVDEVVAELDRWAVMLHGVGHFLATPVEAAEQLWRGLEYWRDQRGCTPADVEPRAPPERRIAILVGGFGSAAGEAAVLDVDTAALGYADGDVAQLSYAGGQAPGERTIEGVPVRTYGPAESQQSLEASAEALRDLLQSVRRSHPGVPVDVIGHSQGGVVALLAMEKGDARDPRMPEIGNVITLGSPHDGTELATAGSVLSRTIAEPVVGMAGGGSDAVDDLSETSSFMRDYRRRPLPEGVRVTSIAASGDLVVPATHSALPGEATNAIVPLVGVSAHDRLPGSDDAHREIALALAGSGPSCRATAGAILGATGISALEDLAGAVLTVPAVWHEVPVRTPTSSPGLPQPGRSPQPRPRR